MFDGPETAPQIKARTVKVADLFCGAGGSSTGASRALAALGIRMDLLCVNHWPVAIETHRQNHPEARHYCQDVQSVRPREVVPDGRLDLLMASPTCTFFSRARGGKPTSDQQRMDPWAIITWLTELRVGCLLVENVPEFVRWGPVRALSGRPVKSREGEYFLRWLQTIRGLGYRAEWRILNAADFGDATTRERFFLIARSDRRPLRWPAPTHARSASADLFGAPAKPWRPAREIIDWSIRGRSIFDRKKPLSPKTLARIHAGAVKLGWPQPFLVVLRQHMAGRSLDEPLPSITAGGTHIGLAEPFISAFYGDSARRPRASRSLNEPLATQTAANRFGLVEPFVLAQASGGVARLISEPVPTIPCGGAHALIAPYYSSGSGKTCRSVDEPLPTVTTRDRFGMVVPVTHAGPGDRTRSVDEPLPTVTCAARGELAFVTAAFGERSGQSPRVHSIGQPVPTICAEGRINLVEPGRDFDILFRMLEPQELARAMGFDDGEAAYEFAGNKTQITRQIGNAVPCNTAAALVRALIAPTQPAAGLSPGSRHDPGAGARLPLPGR